MKKLLCLIFIILFTVSCKKTLFEREGIYFGKNGGSIYISDNGYIHISGDDEGEEIDVSKTFSNSSTDTKFIIEPFVLTFNIFGHAVVKDKKGRTATFTKR